MASNTSKTARASVRAGQRWRAAPTLRRVRTSWARTGSGVVPNSSRSPPLQKAGPSPRSSTAVARAGSTSRLSRSRVTGRHTSKVVPSPIAARKLKRFSGTATDPDGDLLRRVQIALVRQTGGAKASKRGRAKPTCFQLRNARAQFKRTRPNRQRRCGLRWINATGKAKWRFKLRRNLPQGRYTVYTRAIDDKGLVESRFSRKLRNRRSFRVH